MVTSIPVAVVSFASTNIDGFLVLLGLFTSRVFPVWSIIFGQCLGLTILVGTSLVVAITGSVVPVDYFRLVGLVPIFLGAKKISDANQTRLECPDEAAVGGTQSLVAVTSLVVSNGGDNVSVYAPLLATHAASENTVFVWVFAVMAVLWCVAAYQLAEHPALGAPLRRHAGHVLPWALIAIGSAIVFGIR